MPTYETLSLDGLAITGDPTNTLILEQFQAPPPKAKPEWITAADSEWAALARSPLHENREITLRIRVKQQTNMDVALDQIGAVRDKLRKASLTDAGIVMTWAPTNATRTISFDVLHGEITDLPIEPSGDGYGWFLRAPVFTVLLTAKPYWYGTETLSSTANNSTPLQTLEITSGGDIPALGRLIVTDAATQSRRFVEWGLENQDYNSATSLLLDSDNLTVSGFAGLQTTIALFYDPNATGSTGIRYAPSAVATAIAGTGAQSHIGTFRVIARFTSQSIAAHRIRFVWRVGDGPYSTGPWVAPVEGWNELELTTITVPRAAVGTQRWDGRIEVYDSTDPNVTFTPSNLDLDYLLLIPAAEGYGQARATYRYHPGVIVARDDFTGTSSGAALGVRTAPLGGSWATAGATTDFVFNDAPAPHTQEHLSRLTVSDASTALGRYAILGTTNYTDTEVGMRFWRDQPIALNAGMQQGLIARWTDSSNYLLFRFQPGGTSSVPKQIMTIMTVVAGSVSVTRTRILNAWIWHAIGYRLRLVAYANGYVIGVITDDNGNIIDRLDFRDPALATGGTLATGKCGLMEINPSATAYARHYDEFYVATPAAEPIAIYSGRSLEVRHDTVIRQDSAGTYYGRPPSYRGSRFTVPPGTSRVAVRSRRYDVANGDASTTTDSTTIQIGVTPRGLVVPR